MGQTIVEVSGLSRSFGSKSALDNVSFHATAGQVYGLVGSNGADLLLASPRGSRAHVRPRDDDSSGPRDDERSPR